MEISVMISFFGSNPRTVDEKGRVIIPPSFRNKLGDVFYIAKGEEEELLIYTVKGWNEYFSYYRYENKSDKKARRRAMKRSESVMETKCDSQGRLNILQDYREHASIDHACDILVNGVDDHIEIWRRDLYDKFMTEDS
jgi:MraZ protein